MERPLVQISLNTLDAKFVRWIRPDVGPDIVENVWGLQDGADYAHEIVEPFADAEGLRFLCPICYTRERHEAHIVVCWFEGVPPNIVPGPGRWRAIGTSLADLTFVPGQRSESIRLRGGCAWHGFIRHGFATLTTG